MTLQKYNFPENFLKYLRKIIVSARRVAPKMSEFKSRRYVIVHNHMFKNAGTTFDWALQKCFCNGFVDHRDDQSMEKGAEYLSSFICENEHITALSSHHLKFPLPQIEDVTFFHAMLLRHPIDRIGSVYAFEKKQESDTPNAMMAKKLDYNGYVKWSMQNDTPATIRNFQTCKCIDAPVLRSLCRGLTDHEYKLAADRVTGCELLGVVDMFDESMVLFEEYLRPYFPEIDLSYTPQNISSGRASDLSVRVCKVLEELEADVIDFVFLKNYYDLKLYMHAVEVLKKKIKDIPDFSKRLVDFRKRCEKLRI